ncbi:WD40 repeat protein [Saccharothrix ecbatanensis]|uniref:WD40 repeat protein n=1 Tax=Saccharothrix ecbatanensis TaxID=1105145 RepID=A0A7W9HUT9_9PSEU|nr:NACHT domain-containing protein [Saccharothrix ecbatanensis]MBB5808878.1 WD40 repeat protein [Saccharothrix ecbatanensis]
MDHHIPAELAERSDSFVARDWALDLVAAWHDSLESLLVVVAEPGAGKSMLATHLVQIAMGRTSSRQGLGHGWLHAWHFCQAGRFQSLNVRAVLGGIASQLCSTVPGFAEVLVRLNTGATITVNQQIAGDVRDSKVIGIGRLVLPEHDPRTLLDEFIRRPLTELGARATVLVDGVDETDEQDGGTSHTLAWLLSTIERDPIPGLRLMLTTRGGSTARRFAHGQRLMLQQDQPADTDDVLDFVERRLRHAGVADFGSVAGRIGKAADGNFLYAALVTDEFLAGSDVDVDTLPRGLTELYHAFLGRRVCADGNRWRDSIRPVLGLLTQSRGEGFTPHQLALISGLPLSTVCDALEACAPYLTGELPNGPFTTYHLALREYLRSSAEHNIFPAQATQQIITALRGNTADQHAAVHLIGYLIDWHRFSRDDEKTEVHRLTEEIITDPRYLHSRLATTGVDSLLSEVSSLLQAMGRSDTVEIIHETLGRQAHTLRRWDREADQGFALQQLRYDCAFIGHIDVLATSEDDERFSITVDWSAPGISTWLLTRTLAENGRGAYSLNASPDGTMVVVGSYDQKTVVYEVATGAVVHRFSYGGNGSVCFSEDGRKVLARTYGEEPACWDVTSGARGAPTLAEVDFLDRADEQSALPEYVDYVHGDKFGKAAVSAVTPDGRYVAVLSHGRQRQFIALWDLNRREVLSVHDEADVHSLAITPDGSKVITGSYSKAPRVFAPTARAAKHLTNGGHRGQVTATCLSGTLGASIGDDGDLKIWDTTTGRLNQTLSAMPRTDSLAISPDGSRCVLGVQTHKGDIQVFDLQGQFMVRKMMIDGHPVDPEWSTRPGASDPELPAVGVSLDCPLKRPVRLYVDRASAVSAIDISADGRLVVTGSPDGIVRVWDADSGSLVRELSRDGCLVQAVRFTPNGEHVLTVAQIGGLYVEQWAAIEMWSVKSGGITEQLWPEDERSAYPIACDGEGVAITRDGRYLATGSADGTVTVHDLVELRVIGTLVLHGPVTSVSIDGTTVLAGTKNGEVTQFHFNIGQ